MGPKESSVANESFSKTEDVNLSNISDTGSVDGSVSTQVEMVVERNDSYVPTESFSKTQDVKEQVGDELRKEVSELVSKFQVVTALSESYACTDGGTVSMQAEKVVKVNEVNEGSDTKMDDNMNYDDHKKENPLEQNDSYVASEIVLKAQDLNEQVGDELTNEVIDEANENKDRATECSGSENADLHITDNLIPKNNISAENKVLNVLFFFLFVTFYCIYY